MLIPLKNWMILLLLCAAGTVAWYSAYETLPFPMTDDDVVRSQLAKRWAQKVASKLTDLPSRPRVAVARVVNDENGILTAELKKWIGRRNVRMVNDQWYGGVGYWSGACREPQNVESAMAELVGDDLDYLIVAQVENWITYPEFEARLVGFVEIRDGTTGDIVLKYQLSMPELIDIAEAPTSDTSTVAAVMPKRARAQSELSSPSSGVISVPTPATPISMPAGENVRLAAVVDRSTFPWHGFSGWLLTLMGLPLIVSGRLKRLLNRRCNRTNGILLATWIAVAITLAVVLWVRTMPLGWGMPMGLFASALSGVYFAWCCHSLETTR